jgi:hypothetical protein
VATTNKDFVVKQGLKVATGVTFPDNSVQTTAFTGTAITVGSSFPTSPSNGAMHLNTNTNRIYYYYDDVWYALANYDDTSSVTDHTHNEEGFVGDVYTYQGNGPVGPWLGTSLDGGSASTTSFDMVIDGGEAQ